MGGAGAVGGQVMTGMAALARLRRRYVGQIAVWPFQPLDAPVALVEVWPSLLAREIEAARGVGEIKDRAQVRVLAQAIWRMQADGLMEGALAAPEAACREEGWIFGLGCEADLKARAG
jgi:molybdopterin molybdotransferase